MLAKNDIKYIIKKVIIGVLIGIILSFISGVARADSVCLNNQTQWLQSDYTLNTDSLDLDYFYSRPFSNCSEYVRVQIPVRFTKANINIDPSNVQYDTNYLSGQYRLDLSNGDSYYGKLENGYLEFYVRAQIGDVVLYPKHLSLRLPVIGDTYMTISRFIQAYSIDSNNSNVVSSVNNVNNSINNVNNSINDSTPVSNNDVSGNATDWASNNVDSPVINQLVLMPITLLNAFVNGLSSSCSTYSFGTLFDTELTLPCINLSQKLGVVWATIDIILSGVFIFVFGKRCVKIFNDFTNLRSGQIDSLYGGDN